MTVEAPPGSVIVTPTKMYEELQAVGKKVDHLAAILDPSLAQIRAEVSENKERIAVITAERKGDVGALDRRVRALENWRWFVLGVAAALGTAGGYGLSAVFGS